MVQQWTMNLSKFDAYSNFSESHEVEASYLQQPQRENVGLGGGGCITPLGPNKIKNIPLLIGPMIHANLSSLEK